MSSHRNNHNCSRSALVPDETTNMHEHHDHESAPLHQHHSAHWSLDQSIMIPSRTQAQATFCNVTVTQPQQDLHAHTDAYSRDRITAYRRLLRTVTDIGRLRRDSPSSCDGDCDCACLVIHRPSATVLLYISQERCTRAS